MGLSVDSVFAVNSGKKDNERSWPLFATLAEIACISPTLFTVANASKKSAFLVRFLNVVSLRGSNGGAIRVARTLLRSHEGGNTVLFFVSEAKDLISSFKMCDEEISGNFKRNTYASIDLYPLMEFTANFLFLLRSSKKSAIFGRVGRDTDTPFFLHHSLKTDHLCWYITLVDFLLARESCSATLGEKPSCFAYCWKVARHEGLALGDSGGICGNEVV